MTDMIAVDDIHQGVTVTAVHYRAGYGDEPPHGTVLGYRFTGRNVEWVVWTVAADGTTQNGFYTFTLQNAMNRFYERAMAGTYLHHNMIPPALTYLERNPQTRL